MRYWIQRADFETTDLKGPTTAAVFEAFESHDWAAELSYQSQREASGEEWCPPGLGIVADDGRILHLCPQTDGQMRCHYHFPLRRRLLGIFAVQRQATETWLDQRSNASRVIRLFVDDQHGDIIRHLRRVG